MAIMTYPNTSEASLGGTEGGVGSVNLQTTIKDNAQVIDASIVTCSDM